MNLLAVKTDGPHTSYTSYGQSWYMSRIVESTMGSCLQPVVLQRPPAAFASSCRLST